MNAALKTSQTTAQELAELKTAFADAQQKHTESQSRAGSFEELAAQLQQELAQAQGERTSLERNLNDVQQALAAVQEQLHSHERIVAETESESDQSAQIIAEQQAELLDSQKALIAAKVELANLASELAAAGQQLGTLQEQLSTNEKEANQARDEELTAAYEQLSAAKLELAALGESEAAMRASQAEALGRATALDEQAAVLGEREVSIRNCEGSLRQRETALGQREQRLVEQELEIYQRHDSLEQRESQLKHQTSEQSQRDDELTAKAVALDQRDRELNAKAAQLDGRNHVLNAKAAELDERENELNLKESHLSELEDALSLREASVGRREDRFQQREAQLCSHESELNERAAQLEREIVRAQTLKSNINDRCATSAAGGDQDQRADQDADTADAPLTSVAADADIFARLKALSILKEDTASDAVQLQEVGDEFTANEQVDGLAGESEQVADQEQPSLESSVEYAAEQETTTGQELNSSSEIADEHCDESIDDYMSRLLEKYRGPSGSASQPMTYQLPAAEKRKKPAELPTPPTPNDNEATPSARVLLKLEPPRTTAPEKNAGLAAMREIANQTARTAIAVHQVRKGISRIWGKLAVAAFGLVCGGILLIRHNGQESWIFLGGLAALIVAGYWFSRAGNIAHRVRAVQQGDDAKPTKIERHFPVLGLWLAHQRERWAKEKAASQAIAEPIANANSEERSAESAPIYLTALRRIQSLLPRAARISSKSRK